MAKVLAVIFGISTFSLIFNQKGSKILSTLISNNPAAKILFSTIMLLVYSAYTTLTGGMEFVPTTIMAIFIYLPLALEYHAERKGKSHFSWEDLVVVLSFYTVLDLRLLPARTHHKPGVIDWEIAANFCAVITICYFKYYREKYRIDLGESSNINLTNFFKAILILIALAITTIPLGLQVGFLIPKPYINQQPQILMRIGIILWKFISTGLFGVLGYTITVAFMEEVFARGVIYGLLDKYLNKSKMKTTITIFIPAIMFGLWHLNNPSLNHETNNLNPLTWNWEYAAFATFAGVAYGIARKYLSLFWAIIIHASVDVIWGITFIKKLLELTNGH